MTPITRLLAVIILGLAAASCDRTPRFEGFAGPWPDLSLPDLEGRPVNLRRFQGQVALLNFWASWCAPCREEIPDFLEIQKKFSSRGFTIVGVAMDDKGLGEVASFSRVYGLNYPVLYAGDRIKEMMDRFPGVRGYPTTFLLDREGRVARRVEGPAPLSFWEEEIEKLLRN
ncbi:MAG: TlpA disulfide reductase family protein [Pseudomonadota bacterium]